MASAPWQHTTVLAIAQSMHKLCIAAKQEMLLNVLATSIICNICGTIAKQECKDTSGLKQ